LHFCEQDVTWSFYSVVLSKRYCQTSLEWPESGMVGLAIYCIVRTSIDTGFLSLKLTS